MVVPRFVQAAMSGDPLIVHGDGEQTRCFAHVSDIVNALAKALATPGCFGQVINLGNDQEITINDLARLAVEVTQSKSEIRHIPYSDVYGEGFEDMRRRVPSLEKARHLIGYKPTRDLRAIVADVVAELQRLGES
jgi:UDP-glucose 4-epimerase